MGRARAWFALPAATMLVLSGAVGTAPVAGQPLGAVLPVPSVSQPRLGFVDTTDSLRSVGIRAPDPPPPPFPEGPQILPADLARAAPAAAALPDHPQLWDPASQLTLDWVRTGGLYDGEATTTPGPEGAVGTAYVSTVDAVPPAHHGDVYLRGFADDTVRVTCHAARETHPVVSPDGALVAFATDARGDWDIAVAPVPVPDDDVDDECDPDGVVYLTGAEGVDTWPTWLDSDRLVYSSSRGDALGDLVVVSRSSGELAHLTDDAADDVQPAALATSGGWRIVYSTTRDRSDGALGFITVSDSPGYPRVPEDPWSQQPFRPQASEPAWGDSYVAFTSTTNDPAGDVWIAQLAQEPDSGTHVVVGQRSVADEWGVAESHPTWTSWTPGDGTTGPSASLLFTQENPSTDVTDVVADDGSDVREVSADGPGDVPQLASGAGVDYSPDGTLMVLSAPMPLPGSEDPRPPGHRLQILDARTLEEIELDYERNERDVDLDPVWSPDGSTIAFVRWRSYGEGAYADPRIWLVDADGQDLRALTDDGSTVSGAELFEIDPAWAPDSAHLVYVAGDGLAAQMNGPQHLRVARDGDGNGQELVMLGPGCEDPASPCAAQVEGWSPDWSPDGRRIVASHVHIPSTAGEGAPPLLDAPGQLTVLDVSWPAESDVVRSAQVLTGFSPADPPAPTPSRRLVSVTDDPEWSPDGAEVAFTGTQPGQPWALRGVWAAGSASGGPVRQVSQATRTQHGPAYQPYSDLVLSLASSPVDVAGSATLTATLTNAGPGLVAGATLTFALPDGVSPSAATGCATTAGQVQCELVGPIDRGAAVTLDVDLTGVEAAADLTVTGVATTATPERVVVNNSASVVLGVAGGVGVVVGLSTPVAWVGGRPVEATVTVRNAGTVPVTGVRLATSYPGAVAAGGLAPCVTAVGTCDLGTVAGSGVVVLHALLDPSVVFEGAPQTGLVTATVSTASVDPQPADDSSSASLEVRRPRLTISPTVARPGEVVFAAGADFPPGEPVLTAWSVGIMSAPGPHTVSSDGGFRSTVPIIRDTLLAPRTLRAASTSIPPTFGPVETSLLVVPTSADAPTFLFR